MDFGTLRVTYLGNARPVVEAAQTVDRINAQTARNAAQNDRLVERSARQLSQVRTREAKRAADDFIRELNRTRQAERASGGGGIGGELSTLAGGRFAFAGGGAVAGVGALAAGFIAAAKAGVEYRDSINKLERAFTTLLGSEQAAADHLKELQTFTSGTPFEFLEVARASQRFQAMGIEARKVVPILSDIAKAVASIGGGQDEMDRVALAIAQINAKGRVMSQEMNQLSEVGISGWKALQTETGKTREELMKMVEAGDVSAETFNKAFHRMYGDSKALSTQMETLGGATSRLKDDALRLFSEAFTPLHNVLRDTAVELAKISTEGFNAERGLKAAASVFREGFDMANLGGGDSLLIGLALQQGGPQLAAAVQALLRGGQTRQKTWGTGEGPWGQGGTLNIPEEFKYKPKISDEDLIKANKRGAEEWLKQHEKELEDATRKANRESERQSDIIGRISKDFAEASTRVSGFSGDALQLEAALYKLSIGFSTLSEENKKLAQAEINRLFSAKRESQRLEAGADFEKLLTESIKEHSTALRGELTETEKMEDAFQSYLATIEKLTGAVPAFKDEQIKLFDEAFGAARDVDLMNFAERMSRMSDMLRDIPLTITKPVSDIPPPVLQDFDYSSVQVDRMREVAEDLSDIFSNVFESIEGGWKGMWQEMLNVARTTLQEISRDLLRMALTGQKSGAGGIIGLAANWLGSALFGGGGLPTAGASKMGGSYLQPTIPGLASGTMNAKPGLHLVGERGPELVDFRGGEQVFNNRDSRRMMGGTVINKTTIINYQPRVTPDSYASRRSNRETFEALLSFAR